MLGWTVALLCPWWPSTLEHLTQSGDLTLLSLLHLELVCPGRAAGILLSWSPQGWTWRQDKGGEKTLK